MAIDNYSLRLVSLLIGQQSYEDLLILLPDRFFGLKAEVKNLVWDELLNAVNQGIADPETLAKQAQALIDGALEVGASA